MYHVRCVCARTGDYMALPASQYSVLDGNKVERLDDETFRVYVGALKFFTFEIEPVLTLRVHPVEDGCDISMLACKLRGSGLVEAQNSKFASRMTNKGVRIRAHASAHAVQLLARLLLTQRMVCCLHGGVQA